MTVTVATGSTAGPTSEPTTEAATEPTDIHDTARTYPYYLRAVDPRDLRMTGNTRDVGEIRLTRPDLVASVIEHGVDPTISVINVVPDEDGVLRVIVGFSRTAAAITVRENENPDLTVGVFVHQPGTRREHLIAQGVENIHRRGYTSAEEANLYHQLALEDLDDQAIAQALSRPVEQVRAGRAVAGNPRTHAAVQSLPDIDLMMLAKIAEFDDDEQAHQRLVDILATCPVDLDYAIASLRNRRERLACEAAEHARLSELGYTLVEDDENLPDGAARLEELCGADDATPMQPAEHTTCPGRAAFVFVDSDLDVEVVECCLAIADNGHRTLAEAAVAAAEATLREQGIRIVHPDLPTAHDLWRLFADGQAGRTLTAEEHAACPGHAAYVDNSGYGANAIVHYVCDEYAHHGHVPHSSAPAVRTERDRAYEAGERKRARDNNSEWRVAKTARREWLTDFFAGWRKRQPTAKTTRKSAPKAQNQSAPLPAKIQQWLALSSVLASDYLTDAAPAHRYACTLLGLAQPTGYKREDNPITVLLRKKTTTEPQAIMIRLAQVIGAGEEHWDKAYTDGDADASWRRPSDDARFYFALLAALGYPLSPVEELINNPAADVAKWPHLSAAEDDQAA